MVELDQIYKVHDNLYIGAYWPRLNFEKFKEIGITAIVNLMEENFYDPTCLGFNYLYKGFPDDWYPPQLYRRDIILYRSTHKRWKGFSTLRYGDISKWRTYRSVDFKGKLNKGLERCHGLYK